MVSLTKDKTGFTLIELMAVMVILGIFTSVAIKKYNNFSDNAIIMQYDRIERELNVREMVTYIDLRISGGYVDDETMFAKIDYDLGGARWVGSQPARTGGQVRIQNITRMMNRTESTKRKPAEWRTNG